jgi:F-type H+-transporting ATPase subunit delta
MRIPEASKRYARASFELAKAQNAHLKAFEELLQIKKAIESDKTLSSFLETPLIESEAKKKMLVSALAGKASEIVSNLIAVLADKNRLNLLPTIVDAFQESIDEANGVTRGEVSSATALSPESQKGLEETISKVTKKKVILTFKHDPTVIGGLVAQVGGWTFDDTIESHLKKLSEDLNRSAN